MKKLLVLFLSIAMLFSMAACGGKKNSEQPAIAFTENGNESEITVKDTIAEPAADRETENLTTLEISSKIIEAGVYAVDADNKELVFSLFTIPDGTKIASLFAFEADRKNGYIIYDTYESASETEADGITWSLYTVSDAYTGEAIEIGYGESDGEVYIYNASGNPYEGRYLTEDETIGYMRAAAAFLE